MSKIDLLIIEDDIRTCNEYKTVLPRYSRLNLLGFTGDSEKAVGMVENHPPTAIILDLELHNGKGNGLSFLKALNRLKLPSKPFVLVVTNNISTITHTVARNLGADFVITKNQSDYSVEMVLNFLMTFDESTAELNIISPTAPLNKPSAGDDYAERLRRKILSELDKIGVSPKLKGRQYLIDAIELTCTKKRSNLCAEIAKKYSKTDASVERAIQTAINHAWRNTDIETLEKNYTAYINPRKGEPTITEFIYYYADKVNREI